MSARPKLPQETREELQRMESRRRRITKLIARLQDEKRKIPAKVAIARKLNVAYSVVMRAVHGDPYRTAHPDDEQANAA